MKRPITYRRREITMESFVPIIPWRDLENIMGKRNTNAFMKWLRGQTCIEEGCYSCDLKAWLEHGINFD